jgi:hypothetical protein
LGMGRWLWFHNTPTVGCADDIRFIIRDNLKDYIIFLDPLVLKCTVPLFKTYPDQPDHIQHVLALLTPSVIFLLSSGQIETCFVLPLWLQLNWISMALTELHKNKIARLPLLYSLYSLRSCYLYCPSFSFVDHWWIPTSLPKENFHLPEEEQQHVFNAFSDSEARMEFTQSLR